MGVIHSCNNHKMVCWRYLPLKVECIFIKTIARGEATIIKWPRKEQRTVCYKNIKNIRVSMEAVSSFILIFLSRYHQIIS